MENMFAQESVAIEMAQCPGSCVDGCTGGCSGTCYSYCTGANHNEPTCTVL